MRQALDDPATPADVPARHRLPADTRIHQILDAALEAFATDGYAATRIDDIARRAGLSKGGIYTHFKSKEDIFEALLTRALTPKPVEVPALAPGRAVDVELLIERVIDRLYEDLGDGATRLTLRLLFSDGARVKEHVARWREAVLAPYLATIEALVRKGVVEGTLCRSVVVQQPWLLLAPAIFSALWQLALEEATPAFLATHRLAHIALLRELLAPPCRPAG